MLEEVLDVLLLDEVSPELDVVEDFEDELVDELRLSTFDGLLSTVLLLYSI